jgi:hypothetical protein
MATLSEVIQILTIVMGAFPNAKALGDANFRAYHLLLSDLDAQLLEHAALSVAAQNTFFPTAAEIRKEAMGLREAAMGIPSKEDAWAEVSKSFGPYGSWRGAPEWSHPIIKQAIDALGGYIALCRSDNPVADRAHFFRAYEALMDRERRDIAMLPCARDEIHRLSAQYAALPAGGEE